MASGFDYARAYNALPPLEVEFIDEDWCVINPNADAKAQPGKVPVNG